MCSEKFIDFCLKVFLTFEKWTKKMSKNEKLKIICSKTKFVTIKIFMVSSRKKVFQICYDNFFLFSEKKI
jgi:hypothetical protein